MVFASNRTHYYWGRITVMQTSHYNSRIYIHLASTVIYLFISSEFYVGLIQEYFHRVRTKPTEVKTFFFFTARRAASTSDD